MTDEKSILDRMPLAVRVVLLLSYFLIFTLVTAHQVPWSFLFLPDDVVSKWFESDSQRLGILDRLPILFTALCLLASVLILGRTLLRGLRIIPDTKLDLWVLSFSVGMCFTSLYVLLIGLAGGLQVSWLFILPVGLSCSILYF